VKLLIILATVEAIPLMINWITLLLDEAVAVLIIEAVEVTPFTAEVKVLAEDVNELVVVGSNPTIEVVATTPLTFEVTTPPE
jgi:hypothetical protein